MPTRVPAGLVRLTGALTGRDRTWAGGKAVGLAALLRVGVPVPDTWVVPVGTELTEMPAGLLAPLADVAPRWAVRSSATVEDGAARSYAGIFESVLDVPWSGLPSAIARVAASAGGDRLAAYQAGTGGTGTGMAVLLQPYRPPLLGGLWLGRTPSSGRLEWAPGSGAALVSGAVTPDWEEWTHETVRIRATACRTAGSRAGTLAVGRKAVGESCLAVQRALGEPADLEFTILDTGLVWLQFRPVTTALTTVPAEFHKGRSDSVVHGTPASAGRASGRAVWMRETADPRWEPGGVLLTERTDPDWVPLMAEAAALVTAEGGMLCHAAIVARELGVPCVTGVGSAALARLARAGTLAVDGTAGTVSRAPGVS